MADPIGVSLRALGSCFLTQASVKDSSGAAPSEHSFCRYDARKNGQNWACSKTKTARRRVCA